jgi:DNA primase
MPLIKRDFIESLSDKVDIISTIGKRITLTKKGKDYKACCPFHEEKTPSFSVSVDKGAYHCFGCGEGGYALSFVQKFDNLDFVDAVERLADENNIEVEYEEKSSPVDKTIPKLKELNQKVCDFFKQSLRTNPAKQKAVDYAKSRGITGEIAKVFDIGFAPPGNNNLYNHFKKNDDDIKNLEKLGLIIKNDNGTYYERFSDRLIFPILNPRNQVVGFGGRALKSSDKAKYLNSSQSPIFDKSSELYGLTYARKFTKKIEYLLVVEGYMDVVGLHSSGITSCVATLGTATTESHIKTLSRNSHLIIFCFDGDKAGFNAAIKALNTTLPLITADMTIKFLFLPDGEDPDSLVKKEGKLKFEERIKNATNLSEFLFSHLKGDDFKSVEGKTKFIKEAGELISMVGYTVYKSQLIQGLADEVGQSVEVVNKNINPIIQSSQKYPEFVLKTISPEIDPSNNLKKSVDIILYLIISHPILASDKNLNISNFDTTKVIQRVVNAIINGKIKNKKSIIESFKGQSEIYLYLKYLSKWYIFPKFTEHDSKKEIIQAVKNANEILRKQKIIKKIESSTSTESQKEIQKDIKSRKIKLHK